MNFTRECGFDAEGIEIAIREMLVRKEGEEVKGRIGDEGVRDWGVEAERKGETQR